MAFDKYGYICPYNEECRCQVADCEICGWNPAVSERRLETFLQANQDADGEETGRKDHETEPSNR